MKQLFAMILLIFTSNILTGCSAENEKDPCGELSFSQLKKLRPDYASIREQAKEEAAGIAFAVTKKDGELTAIMEYAEKMGDSSTASEALEAKIQLLKEEMEAVADLRKWEKSECRKLFPDKY